LGYNTAAIPDEESQRMRHLWSPWRLDYLTEPKAEGCVFCHAAASQADRENLVLLRGEHAFMILNRFPYNNGHYMVVPYAHVPSLEVLDAPALTEMMLLLNRGLAALHQSMQPDGFNVGANLGHCAGAGIDDHVHLHVVPRWTGDTNFMPIVGNMRVVPETWLQTYDRLKAVLDALADPGGIGDTHP
jgi:ATP adenylyltransferase